MSAEHPTQGRIAELERVWLGKTVRVRETSAQLQRFAGRDGLVKAVNQNGRCLVTFDASEDAGWYDVEPTFLRLSEDESAGP